MASEEDPTVYGEEDLDEDDDDEESEEEDLTLVNHPPPYDDDDDVDVDDDSTSSSNLAPGDPPPSSIGEVTIAVAGVSNGGPIQPVAVSSLPDPKRQRIENVSIATVVEEKKPSALDESRRLFQRLWTDEDEIELLQGFLDYTTQRGTNNSSHHHDTTAFYDQIKCKLQLDFNKNQLVEKLRRLKKKYRNVLSKIGSGKEYVFKSPHDQATFEISRKIWSGANGQVIGGGGGGGSVVAVEEGGLDDDEGNPNPNPHPLLNDPNHSMVDANNSEKKVPRPRKRSRGGVKIEEKNTFNQQSHVQPATTATPSASIPNLIEDTVKSCLSPLFKELIHNVMNGPCGSRGFGGVTMNPMPLSFGGSINFSGGDMVDEKWRKQHILELEVYSKRLELVQDQVKSQLEELRSIGS